MKAGIIGCGQNAAYHIAFIRAYPKCEIVGLVDKDQGRAERCAQKYGIGKTFSTLEELVGLSNPDVIHIVTPPHTHHRLAKEAIESKCHVLVEKPMTLNVRDARELYVLAEEQGVKLCTMHNHWFDPCMMKARDLIARGRLGRIINVESHYGLNTRIDAFRRYPAPNVLPWIYTLPGGAFHDFMPHPLYVMLPYTGTPRRIEVLERSFGELPQGLSDELRVLIEGKESLGSLTFSFTAKPHLHYLRILGTKMMIQVDFNTMTTTVHPVSGFPKAAQKATYNLTESLQLFSSTVSNVWKFGTGRLRPYQGMKTLIHLFYDALHGQSQAPVRKEEALAVIETMDDIFGRIRKFPFRFEPILPRVLPKTDRKPSRILVTGATGFLGKRLVRVLLGRGYRVRALARKLSHTETLRGLDLEIYFGDVADPESLRASFDGVDYVIHAAADTAGNPEGGRVSTIRGTENVIQLCRDFGVKKLVYISSCGVYAVSKLKNHQTVTEGSPLEAFPEKRGSYSHAKLEAETRVRRAMSQGSAPVVCLRPGTIYGPGGEIFTPMMGFSLGRKLFLIIRRPGFVLPFVYVDNLIEAIVASLEAPNSAGQIYNVVDPEKIGKKEYVERFLKRLLPGSRYIYLPYSFIYSAVALQEILFKILKRNPLFTRYRLTSSQRKIVYDASKIKHDLHWSCPVSMNEAFKQILDDALREVSREGSGEDDRGKNSDRHRDGTESPLAPEDGLSEGDPGKRTNGEGSLRLDEEVPTRL